ncbi:pyridoxal-phosphate dependent TrpB-like enzyme [Thermodesulfatator indicus DSM 15286]|uniref:Tryptophan synthase beta chain n=1 Tax=Thermodesulfatator indicus (strain DSM 15286 / JCM 11887 / CIR29812) TaxID=667014 RepID=F8A920_THEID|nr:TrpB-like pyridoxal phosphate-dependent enzyme [Thermodesulfatator indicus]AEH45148.1 pyridoxal-phosphate dependent TrpB-like enzyme [Thermodesulfatator indicus DSM 15286]
MDDTKILLSENELPEAWYNIIPRLPNPPAPPLNPQTKEPVKPEDLEPIFPKSLIEQEMSPEPWVEIPGAVREIYKLWRPTPLQRARNLEKALGTPARIYFKNESVSPPGSHKPNTAVAQAYYNKEAGIKRLATETGAGQWGSALSFACKLFGLECTVYMVKVSFEQKPFRKSLMHIWGAEVFPSPTNRTQAGRKILEENPDSTGSLGIAISEAVEDAATHEDTNYALGSVLNHVLLHQTVIGLETQKQLALAGEKPDILIGCVGGGSNFAGFTFPFIGDIIEGKLEAEVIAVEPTSCPTLTKGIYTYDFGDTAGLTPLLLMHTLGHSFEPPAIHAGGLRYHGDAPLVCQLVKDGYIKPRAYPQNPCFEAAVLFAQTEGIIPAPETSHAIKAAVDEALKCKETGEEKVIVFGFSGHGHFDLAAYDAYLEGKLEDYEYPEEKIKEALEALAHFPKFPTGL